MFVNGSKASPLCNMISYKWKCRPARHQATQYRQLIHLEISTMSCRKHYVVRNAVSLCAFDIASLNSCVKTQEWMPTRRQGAYASIRDRLHDNLLTFPHALFHCLHGHYVLVKASPTYTAPRLANVIKTVTLLSHKSSNVPLKWCLQRPPTATARRILLKYH